MLLGHGMPLTGPNMHRHGHSHRLNKPGKWRAVTFLGLLAIAVCSLLAVHPVLKGRTLSILPTPTSKVKSYSVPDDSQIARERAIKLKLSPAGQYPINKYDLVSAMPSDQTHLPVVKGSRSWRKVYQQQHTTPAKTASILLNCPHPHTEMMPM